jgi:hypothetical protein
MGPMSRRLTFVAGLAVLAGLALAAAAAPASRPSPRSMVLQLSDLPAGYGLAHAQVVSNADLKAKDPAWKDYRKLGRITGYNASFTGFGVGGVTEIDAFASVYKTGVGAHNSLLLTLVQANSAAGTKIVDAGRKSLGHDELVYSMKGSTPKEALFTVAWRRGAVFAEVIGAGPYGRLHAADVVALAKKQDVRIARALKA